MRAALLHPVAERKTVNITTKREKTGFVETHCLETPGSLVRFIPTVAVWLPSSSPLFNIACSFGSC
jgi:hypothetical protein